MSKYFLSALYPYVSSLLTRSGSSGGSSVKDKNQTRRVVVSPLTGPLICCVRIVSHVTFEAASSSSGAFVYTFK